MRVPLLLVHGGAGTKTMSEERHRAYVESLKRILEQAYPVLARGGETPCGVAGLFLTGGERGAGLGPLPVARLLGGNAMSLLFHKGLLAVTAVLDVALHTDDQPVASRTLAHRHRLPPRHLEPVLQALVHAGILKGIRGPRGGYQLARDPRQITADDILRAIGTIEEQEEVAAAKSRLLAHVVEPVLAQAEIAFSAALAQINIEDLVGAADMMRRSAA